MRLCSKIPASRSYLSRQSHDDGSPRAEGPVRQAPSRFALHSLARGLLVTPPCLQRCGRACYGRSPRCRACQGQHRTSAGPCWTCARAPAQITTPSHILLAACFRSLAILPMNRTAFRHLFPRNRGGGMWCGFILYSALTCMPLPTSPAARLRVTGRRLPGVVGALGGGAAAGAGALLLPKYLLQNSTVHARTIHALSVRSRELSGCFPPSSGERETIRNQNVGVTHVCMRHGTLAPQSAPCSGGFPFATLGRSTRGKEPTPVCPPAHATILHRETGELTCGRRRDA